MVELAQFPVTARSGGQGVHEADLRVRASGFIMLAQGVVDAIWPDSGALNQGYDIAVLGSIASTLGSVKNL